VNRVLRCVEWESAWSVAQPWMASLIDGPASFCAFQEWKS
jgi:hypothetical protein